MVYEAREKEVFRKIMRHLEAFTGMRARKMRGADWGELRVLRDLQVDVIGGG